MGDRPRFSALLTDINGVPVTPGRVVLRIQQGANPLSRVHFEYPPVPQINELTPLGTGHFGAYFTLSSAGDWIYRWEWWEGSNIVLATADQRIRVLPTLFT